MLFFIRIYKNSLNNFHSVHISNQYIYLPEEVSPVKGHVKTHLFSDMEVCFFSLSAEYVDIWIKPKAVQIPSRSFTVHKFRVLCFSSLSASRFLESAQLLLNSKELLLNSKWISLLFLGHFLQRYMEDFHQCPYCCTVSLDCSQSSN